MINSISGMHRRAGIIFLENICNSILQFFILGRYYFFIMTILIMIIF